MFEPPIEMIDAIGQEDATHAKDVLINHVRIVYQAMLVAIQSLADQVAVVEDEIRQARPPPPDGWRQKHNVFIRDLPDHIPAILVHQ